MIYKYIVLGLWIVFLLVWFISSLTAKKTATRNTLQISIGFRLLVSVLFIIIIQNVRPNLLKYEFFSPQISGIIAVSLTALGVGFAIWARFYLGRNWGMPMSMRQEHELVTTGPYAYVRHPIYTGILLAILGAVFVTGFVWFIIFVFFVAFFSYSAKKEERLMTEKFPTEYAAYKLRSKMLIPFVF